jgi:hypothetical protein
LTISGGHGERVVEEWREVKRGEMREINAEFAESAEGPEKRRAQRGIAVPLGWDLQVRHDW